MIHDTNESQNTNKLIIIIQTVLCKRKPHCVENNNRIKNINNGIDDYDNDIDKSKIK